MPCKIAIKKSILVKLAVNDKKYVIFHINVLKFEQDCGISCFNLKKKVDVGLRKDGFVEIIDGLSSFDLVVYEGINKIKEGTSVKIK